MTLMMMTNTTTVMMAIKIILLSTAVPSYSLRTAACESIERRWVFTAIASYSLRTGEFESIAMGVFAAVRRILRTCNNVN